MRGWEKYRLDEIAEIWNHKRIPLSSLQRKDRQGKYPYYGASGIIDSVDDYIFDGEYVLISEDGENLRSRKTPIAFKALGKFWVNNHAHIVKGIKPFINDWIVFYLQNLDLTPFITGAVQPKLNKENLLQIPFYMPEFGKAEEITEILSSLDDKIELNNQINENLEALSQAIFKHWFIDFEFPDENGNPYKSSGGKMVDSELGLIPEGWTICSLLKDNLLIGGGTPKTSVNEYWDMGEINWITAKDVTPNNGGFILETEKKITKLGLDNSSAKLVRPFSTVITARGTVGNLCVIPHEMAISQSNYAISSKSNFNFFLFLQIRNLMQALIQRSYGTVFNTVTTQTLKETMVPMPSEDIQRSFEVIVSSLFMLSLNSKNESLQLSKLRDEILPKLISGKLKVNYEMD